MTEAVTVALIVSVPATVTAVTALVVAIRKINQLSVQVNGRLTQLLTVVGSEQFAAGLLTGRAAADARTDVLAEQVAVKADAALNLLQTHDMDERKIWPVHAIQETIADGLVKNTALTQEILDRMPPKGEP